MLSVGIYGATGYMGAPFTRALLKAHRGSLLRLVILHRPGSDLTRYPQDKTVETRCIDLEAEETASLAKKLTDLQVVVSCVSYMAFRTQYALIDALKGSKELVT